MTAKPDASSPRFEIVDALRGSALLGILLLHSVEHFDFLRYPQNSPAWLQSLNQQVRDSAFFLFGGKAYAIFALMVGRSFFLILDRSAKRGVNFRWRFLWRLAVLGIIGYVHSLLYCGDILTVLAVLGAPLVLLYGVDRRVLGVVSLLLLLQLPSLWQLSQLTLDPAYAPPPTHYGQYYRQMNPVFANGSLADVCRVNLLTGQLAKWWWTIDNGRYLQMIGLFVWGLLIGRSRVFENPAAYVRLAQRVLALGLVGFALLYYSKLHVASWLPRGPALRVTSNLVESYCDLAQMLVWAGGFVLLYHFTPVRTALRLLAPFGRMSLTCYVTQALVWVPVYYGFGLGLFRHLGQFYSVLCGAAFFVVQCAVAHWWLKRFQYGPLEWVWRGCTRLSFTNPRLPLPATALPPS